MGKVREAAGKVPRASGKLLEGFPGRGFAPPDPHTGCYVYPEHLFFDFGVYLFVISVTWSIKMV